MTNDQVIHAARFGDRDNAHDILQNTGAPQHVIDKIKWFTDRSGSRWDDSVGRTHSGYFLENHYLVQATVPDVDADRSGMVKTTVLLIPDSCIDRVDLGRALHVVAGLTTSGQLNPIESATIQHSAPCPHAPGSSALMDMLASTRQAVWMGRGAQGALACVWRHLSGEDRRVLAFANTDHPSVVALPSNDHDLRVLVAPEPLPAAFANKSTVGITSSVPGESAAAALLDSDGHPASDLGIQLGLTKPTLGQWDLLIGAERELRELNELTPQRARATLDLLALLAPLSSTGTAVKRRVLEHLQGSLQGEPYATVRSLRTMPWSALPEPGLRQDLIRSWVRHAAARRDARSVADALDDLQTRGESWFPELQEEITAAVVADFRLAAQVTAELLLRRDGVASLRTALRRCHQKATAEFDREIVESLRRSLAIGMCPAGWAADEVLREGWADTHATVIDVSDPALAWHAHVPIMTPGSAAILVDRVAPKATVAAAFDLAHAELIAHAGRLAATDSTLLLPPEPENPAYRRVWAAAVRCGMPTWACCDQENAIPVLIGELLSGNEVDNVLLEAVVDDAGPVLASHPFRAELWLLPSTDLIQRLRVAAADNIARRLKVGDPQPERGLARQVLEAPTLTALAREQPDQAVTVLQVLEEFVQDQHGELVVTTAARMSPAAARRLGALVNARGWSQTARCLVASGRSDLQPALPEAVRALGLFERLFLKPQTSGGRIPEPSWEEVSAALIDELSNVYPQGPPIDLWERAGGRASDLPQTQTGRSRWTAALRAIERGSARAPSLSDLLDAAHDEYPRNKRLTALRAHPLGSRSRRRK